MSLINIVTTKIKLLIGKRIVSDKTQNKYLVTIYGSHCYSMANIMLFCNEVTIFPIGKENKENIKDLICATFL